MLLLDCTACGRRELRTIRSIHRMEHTDHGIVVSLRCHACHRLNHLITGRPTPDTTGRPAEPDPSDPGPGGPGPDDHRLPLAG